MENNICKCGHLESKHCHMRKDPCSCKSKFCDLSFDDTNTSKGTKHCPGYQQDNLKYLEQLYESRTK